MSVCPNCGATDNIGNFCESCGAPLPLEQPARPAQLQPAPAPQPASGPQPIPVQPVYEQLQPAPGPQAAQYQPAPAPQPIPVQPVYQQSEQLVYHQPTEPVYQPQPAYAQPGQGYQGQPAYQQPGQGYQGQPGYPQPGQGYQGQPGYPQPGQGYQPQPYAPTIAPKKATNGACIAGCILGLVGIFTFGIPSFIGFIVSTIGVIVASVKKQKGKVLGIIGMVLSLLMVVGVILFFANADKISEALSDASGEGQSFEEWLFDDSYDGKIEIISETEWIDKNSGAGMLFEANDNFKYYKNHNDLTNNYYTGTYEIYFGYEAMEILETKYGQYGVTSDSICDEIDNERGLSGVSEFMILVLHNDGCWVDGENTIDLKWDKVYMGYYDDNRNNMDLTCLDDNKNYAFVSWDDFN